MKTFRTPRPRSLVDAFLTAILTPAPRSRSQLGAVDLGESVERQLGRIAGDVDKFIAAQKTRFGELDTRQEQLSARLQDVEQKSVRSRGASGPADGRGPSVGEQVEAAFTAGDARDLLRKTGRLTLDIEAAITTTGTGGSHGNLDVPAAPGLPGTSLVSILAPGDLAGMTTLHYARKTGSSGAAAAQDAEGVAKATAEPIFSPISQAVITVAGLATLSEQSLNAAGGLARAVNSHLRKAVADAVDAILIDGTAASQWPFAGFEALAATLTAGAGYTAVIDAVIVAATRMRLQGFNPTIAVLPEAAFLQTQLGRGTDGHYLLAASMLRDAGLRLALSNAIAAGKALLIDPTFVGYLSSGATRITIGTINDQFSKNMLTIKGEVEIAPYFADYQSALLVTPASS